MELGPLNFLSSPAPGPGWSGRYSSPIINRISSLRHPPDLTELIYSPELLSGGSKVQVSTRREVCFFPQSVFSPTLPGAFVSTPPLGGRSWEERGAKGQNQARPDTFPTAVGCFRGESETEKHPPGFYGVPESLTTAISCDKVFN